MTEEIVFLRAIRERPDDDTARLVYADWLEDQGGEQHAGRAAFIRADREMASLPEVDERREPLQARLRELAASLDVVWRATVSKARIETCTFRFKFEFACPRQWDQLAPTEARSIRRCDACKQNVHYCATRQEAIRHAARHHCIAVDAGVVLGAYDLKSIVVGKPSVLGLPAWDKPDPTEEPGHE